MRANKSINERLNHIAAFFFPDISSTGMVFKKLITNPLNNENVFNVAKKTASSRVKHNCYLLSCKSEENTVEDIY